MKSTFYVVAFVLVFITNCHAADASKIIESERARDSKKFSPNLNETLDQKLKTYESNRSNKFSEDKYGVKLENNLSSTSQKFDNPALRDQAVKSDNFKRVYVGPKEAEKNKNLGFKFSIPLERD